MSTVSAGCEDNKTCRKTLACVWLLRNALKSSRDSYRQTRSYVEPSEVELSHSHRHLLEPSCSEMFILVVMLLCLGPF